MLLTKTVIYNKCFFQGCIKQLLLPLLDKFISAFLAALSSKDPEVTDVSIKTEIVKTLTVLVRNVASHIKPQIQPIIGCVWQTLVQSSELYLKSSVYQQGGDGDQDLNQSYGEFEVANQSDGGLDWRRLTNEHI